MPTSTGPRMVADATTRAVVALLSPAARREVDSMCLTPDARRSRTIRSAHGIRGVERIDMATSDDRLTCTATLKGNIFLEDGALAIKAATFPDTIIQGLKAVIDRPLSQMVDHPVTRHATITGTKVMTGSGTIRLFIERGPVLPYDMPPTEAP